MAEISAKSAPGATAAERVSPKPAVPKMSFASVAARAANTKPNKPAASSKSVENHPVVPVSKLDGEQTKPQSPGNTQVSILQEAAANLAIDGRDGPVIASVDTDLEQPRPQPVTTILSNDDEKTHLSFVSNPTVSTDVRSVISGTAFNMDEKESIRPDESASVKAADDSDSASAQDSGDPQSLSASEAGKNVFQDQFQEVSAAQRAFPLTTKLAAHVADDSGRNIAPAAIDLQAAELDEKLLEALENPKDRIFLLQMEQEVIQFVSKSKETVLSLPPHNAFCRLLAHRLGDWYGLSHVADPQSGSVRMGKTEATRLAPPLKTLATVRTPEPGVQQQPALKIMRRKTASYGKETAGDETGASSAAHSQTGSDNGASGADIQSSPSKVTKNMSREEREAYYQAARDKIFGEMEEPKPLTETSTAASRASSTTGGGKGKKHKNRPKNDDFEPRSMFMSVGYQQHQQQGYAYSDRQQQGGYGFSTAQPQMPTQPAMMGYSDGSVSQAPTFHPQQPQVQHQQMSQMSHMPIQMQPQQIQMGVAMPGYGQPPGYGPQPMYNGAYVYGPQAQVPMGPMPTQFYPAPEQNQQYTNMIGGPMVNPGQQGYMQAYQSWPQGMAMPYGAQEQQGYYPPTPQGGAPGGFPYQGQQKPPEGTTPPAVRFNQGEYPMNPTGHAQQPQSGQWAQWQGSAYGQYSNTPGPWQGAQPGMQGAHMTPPATMQPPNANAYASPPPHNGKNPKKGGNRGNGRANHSELGKYDTSSLPPKPPVPVPNEQ